MVANWHLDGDAIDATGNTAPATSSGSPAVRFAAGQGGAYGQAASFAGSGELTATGVPVDTTAGASTTVDFWMKWDGTPNVIPFAFRGAAARQSLWIDPSGHFGLCTENNSEVYGVSAAVTATMNNTWTHITAVFVNGTPSAFQLSINGVPQSLTLYGGAQTPLNARVDPTVTIGGGGAGNGWRFAGSQVDEVRITKGAVAPWNIADACATTTRCRDSAYAGPTDILRAGARYWTRSRLHTARNDYWTSWANDWIETDSTTSISISVNPNVDFGTPTLGTDGFASSTILVTSDDAGGYQLLAHDSSNTTGLTGTPAGTVPDFQPPASAPAAWPASSPLGIGFTVRNATGGRLPKWGATGPFAESDVTNNLYAALGITDVVLHQRTTYSAATDTIVLTTRLNAPTNTPAGTYTGTVALTALANP
ncbi:MAG: hypothetical protein JWN72_519 [Thermoleophilia bacterium]|nr:hypothetical protein [Thermoleophilia bacterium]